MIYDHSFVAIKTKSISSLISANMSSHKKMQDMRSYLQELEFCGSSQDQLICNNIDIVRFSKSRILDFDFFYMKALMQLVDFLKIKQISPHKHQHVSRIWTIVTIYYFAFYCITAMEKIWPDTGLIYINESTANILNKNSPILSLYKAFVPHSYKFDLDTTNIIHSITLKKTSLSTHELSWNWFYNTIFQYMKKSAKYGTLEDTAIKKMDSFFINYKSYKYPSEIRNAINYMGNFIIDECDYCLPYININSFNDIFTIHANKPDVTNDLNSATQSIFCMGLYLFGYIKELREEFKSTGFTLSNKIDIYIESQTADILKRLENILTI